MSIRNFSIILITLFILMIGLSSTDIFFIYQDSTETAEIYKQEKHNIKLAREMMDDSRHLVRSVRMYTMSGDPQYKEEFFKILESKSSQLLRNVKPGTTISPQELMKDFDFTEEESMHFFRAYQMSTKLISKEIEAINAVDGLFKDKTGAYTIKREPNRQYAQSLVFSSYYNNAINKISDHLTQFFSAVEKRTEQNVDQHITSIESNIRQLFYIKIIELIILCLVLLYIIFRICSPIVKISKFAQNIINGDNQSRVCIETKDEIGTLAKSLNLLLDKQARMIENLKQMGLHDALTGFGNRYALQNTCEQLFDREHTSIGIVYVDLNCLKFVNDKFGHECGDDYITSASQIFLKFFRRNDLFRIGGDEFIFLCPSVSQTDFESRLQDMMHVCNQQMPGAIALGHVWHEKTGNIDAMINQADQLMYEEKQRIKSHGGMDGLIDFLSKRYASFSPVTVPA